MLKGCRDGEKERETESVRGRKRIATCSLFFIACPTSRQHIAMKQTKTFYSSTKICQINFSHPAKVDQEQCNRGHGLSQTITQGTDKKLKLYFWFSLTENQSREYTLWPGRSQIYFLKSQFSNSVVSTATTATHKRSLQWNYTRWKMTIYEFPMNSLSCEPLNESLSRSLLFLSCKGLSLTCSSRSYEPVDVSMVLCCISPFISPKSCSHCRCNIL